jgi:hypothetical protein
MSNGPARSFVALRRCTTPLSSRGSCGPVPRSVLKREFHNVFMLDSVLKTMCFIMQFEEKLMAYVFSVYLMDS